MKAVFGFLFLLVLFHISTASASTLRVGAVQFIPIAKAHPSETVTANAHKHATLINQTTSSPRPVSLLVFPEFALLGNISLHGKNKQDVKPYCLTLPPTGSFVATNCIAAQRDATSIVACAALAASPNLTVSFNVCELASSEHGETTDGDFFLYNTQVVVRNGVLLQKYRKYHVFFTFVFDSPRLEIRTFNVSSPTAAEHHRFGLFTCFDILFKDPKDDLVEMGVKFFSYSSAIPSIGKEAVAFFSWEKQVTVVNANLPLGVTSVVKAGKELASCGKEQGDCIAYADV